MANGNTFVYARSLNLGERQGLSVHAEQDVEIKRSDNILTIWVDGICLLRIYAPRKHVRLLSNLYGKGGENLRNLREVR